jgi:endonuclease YncB( thermonuclease family)
MAKTNRKFRRMKLACQDARAAMARKNDAVARFTTELPHVTIKGYRYDGVVADISDNGTLTMRDADGAVVVRFCGVDTEALADLFIRAYGKD